MMIAEFKHPCDKCREDTHYVWKFCTKQCPKLDEHLAKTIEKLNPEVSQNE